MLTCCWLLSTCYLLFSSWYLLLDNCCLYLYLLLATCCILLSTCYLLFASCYFILATFYLLLASCYLLLVTYYLLPRYCSWQNFQIKTSLGLGLKQNQWSLWTQEISKTLGLGLEIQDLACQDQVLVSVLTEFSNQDYSWSWSRIQLMVSLN